MAPPAARDSKKHVELSKKEKKLTDENADLRADVCRLEDKLANAEQLSDVQTAECKSLLLDINRLTEERNQYQAECALSSSAQRKYDQLQASALERKLDQLQAERSAAEQKAKESDERVKAVERTAAAMRTRIEALEAELKDAHQGSGGDMEEVRAARTEARAAVAKQEELAKQLKARTESSQLLFRGCEELVREHQETCRQLAEAKETCDKLAEAKKEACDKLEEASEKLAEVEEAWCRKLEESKEAGGDVAEAKTKREPLVVGDTVVCTRAYKVESKLDDGMDSGYLPLAFGEVVILQCVDEDWGYGYIEKDESKTSGWFPTMNLIAQRAG